MLKNISVFYSVIAFDETKEILGYEICISSSLF